MGHGFDQRTMESIGGSDTGESSPSRRSRPTLEEQSGSSRRYPVGASNRSAVDGPARPLSAIPNVPLPLPAMVIRSDEGDSPSIGPGYGRTRRPGPFGSPHPRFLLKSQKKGDSRGEDQTRKGQQNHGHCRRQWSSSCPKCSKSFPARNDARRENALRPFRAADSERLIGGKANDRDDLAELLDHIWKTNLIAPHWQSENNRTSVSLIATKDPGNSNATSPISRTSEGSRVSDKSIFSLPNDG